jgi:hypothetical protein
MHELKQLVDDSFQELPMCFEEPWILPHDIHDVGRDYGLVVFTTLDLAQTKEILDDCHKEALFCLLIYRLGVVEV